METYQASLKILLVVPAYNEEASLSGVLIDLQEKMPGCDVLVVNDGSLDDTSRVAHGAGVTVIDLSYNLGIGGAVQTGFKYALRNGYDAIVQVDGDGQHPAEEIPRLLETLRSERCDLVIGSRFLRPTSYRGSGLRRIAIAFLSWLCSRLSGIKITDSTSGFRAFGRRALTIVADNYPVDYPEPKSIYSLARQGMRIREVSVSMRTRESGTSSLSGLKALHYVTNVTLALLVDAIRERPAAGRGADP